MVPPKVCGGQDLLEATPQKRPGAVPNRSILTITRGSTLEVSLIDAQYQLGVMVVVLRLQQDTRQEALWQAVRPKDWCIDSGHRTTV